VNRIDETPGKEAPLAAVGRFNERRDLVRVGLLGLVILRLLRRCLDLLLLLLLGWGLGLLLRVLLLLLGLVPGVVVLLLLGLLLLRSLIPGVVGVPTRVRVPLVVLLVVLPVVVRVVTSGVRIYENSSVVLIGFSIKYNT